MTAPQPEPIVGATYVATDGREHTVVEYRRPRHHGAEPLVTVLEGGARKLLTLADWRKHRYGPVMS